MNPNNEQEFSVHITWWDPCAMVGEYEDDFDLVAAREMIVDAIHDAVRALVPNVSVRCAFADLIEVAYVGEAERQALAAIDWRELLNDLDTTSILQACERSE